MGTTTHVRRYLERHGRAATRELLSTLRRREPRYLYDLVRAYPSRPGKGLRPSLCVATCGAFGGDTQAVRRTAAAIEAFHNASLVHDDVEDRSLLRRGEPTLSVLYGMPLAVNAGDGLNAHVMHMLRDNVRTLGARTASAVWREFAEMARHSTEGQAIELGWIRENICVLTRRDYLRMILKKTCWYTCISPCRIGALAASVPVTRLDRFNRFGFYLGAAFQIQDDLLNLTGDPQAYGKEINGDIWEGKRTLMVIHLLEHASAREREMLRRFLRKQREGRMARDVQSVRQLLERHGSIDYARSCARQLAGAAAREFYVAYRDASDNEHKRFIEGLVMYMIERES